MGEDRLLISEAASKALFNLLSNSGSLRGRTLDQIHERLIEVVNRLWEGGKVSSFVDNKGGGWLIDISRGFNDMMLYAVARSVDGNRAVIDVIDEAELDAMKKGPGEPQEPAAEPEKKWADGGKAKLPNVVQHVDPPPESPALLRYLDRGPDSMENVQAHWEVIELEYSKVGAKVQELMSEGVSPGDIEIWTQRKVPQVKVELV